MEFRIRELSRKLSFLGYRNFEIRRMLETATGTERPDPGNRRQCRAAVAVLEKYERLGSRYMRTYSK
ncbi:MAG TPA: hypothetical protein PKA10_03575 [Selenomonadales bacterium]|nr:hypothetical protein [Selenomonadales bacterium]